jgi:hypothetical protein
MGCYCSDYIIIIIIIMGGESNRRWEDEKCVQHFCWRPDRRLLGRYRHRWVDNMKWLCRKQNISGAIEFILPMTEMWCAFLKR